MHQKNNSTGASSGAAEDKDGENTTSGEGKLTALTSEPEQLRNPFEDDEEEIDDDDDSDDGDEKHGSSAAGGGSWGNAGRGNWWRGVVRGRRNENLDGREDSDEDDDDDEEFGDFAMPEVDAAPTASDRGPEKVLLKPVPVHPPAMGAAGGAGQKSAFGSLWPFTGQSFATKDIKDKANSSEPSAEEGVVIGEDGKRISRTVEAKRRTSLDDPDEDEVVV
jgi:hypothetical protein